MSVSTRLAHHFDAKVRARGSDLRRFGCVSLDDRVFDAEPEHLSALVEGTSDDYTVDLWIRREGLAVACTCPYFEATGPCKHIWAAILEANDYEVFDFPGSRPLNLWHALPDIFSAPEAWQPKWRNQIARLSGARRGGDSVRNASLRLSPFRTTAFGSAGPIDSSSDLRHGPVLRGWFGKH